MVVQGIGLQVVAGEASSIYVLQRVRMVLMHVAQTITPLNATSWKNVTSLPYIRPILELDQNKVSPAPFIFLNSAKEVIVMVLLSPT